MSLITVLVKIFGETSIINTAMVYAVLTFLNTSRGPDVGGIGVGGFGCIGAFFLDNFRSREMSSPSSEMNDSSSLDTSIRACSSCFWAETAHPNLARLPHEEDDKATMTKKLTANCAKIMVVQRRKLYGRDV